MICARLCFAPSPDPERSRAQVSIQYLLSADFAQLATQRTGKNDPTFIDPCSSLMLTLLSPVGSEQPCFDANLMCNVSKYEITLDLMTGPAVL